MSLHDTLLALADDIPNDLNTAQQVIDAVALLLNYQSAFEAQMGCHARASELRMAARIARGALELDRAERPIHPGRRSGDN